MDRTLLAAIICGLLLALAAWHWKHRRVTATDADEPVASQPAARANGSARTPASCRRDDLRLRLPITGSYGKDWLLANFFDADEASSQVRDYKGAVGADAITYNGHTGVDFELPGFRAMDEGVPVLAAAEGIVEKVYDQAYDRNRTCVQAEANEIRVRHANGFATVYMHLRKSSALVHEGDHVSVGQKLALVGSSGCSSYPHLHLETLDCQGRPFDTMAAKLFDVVLTYPRSMPPTVMEAAIYQPAIHDVLAIQEPEGPDRHQVAVSQYFSIGVTIANLRGGDRVRFDFLTPNNTVWEHSFETRADKFYTRSHWYSNFEIPNPGAWIARISINGQVVLQRPFQVIDFNN